MDLTKPLCGLTLRLSATADRRRGLAEGLRLAHHLPPFLLWAGTESGGCLHSGAGALQSHSMASGASLHAHCSIGQQAQGESGVSRAVGRRGDVLPSPHVAAWGSSATDRRSKRRDGPFLRDVLLPSPVSALKPLISSSSSTFIHPLPGKPLDPNSPLALALAARERALSSQVPSRSPTPIHSPDSDRAAPLFVDIQTKEPERGDLEGLVSPVYSPGAKGAAGAGPGTLAPTKSHWGTPTTLRKETETRAETPGKEEKKTEDKKSLIISIVDTSQQKTAGLIMVHATSNGQEELGLEMKEEKPDVPEESTEPAELPKVETEPSPVGKSPVSPASDKTLGQGSSEEEVEPYTVTLPPAQLSSSDEETREELAKIGLVPPPDEFANGVLVTTPGTPISQLAKPSTPSIPAAAVAPSTTGGTPSGKPSDAPAAPESAADSGVEEVDTRSSSDHHLETTSTISTVSSMSTLSSESGEPTDTYTSFADGQTFILEKPPVPPKPKLKSQLSKGPVTFRDPLLKQSSDSELISQQHAATLASASVGRPRYLFQRRSKLWGDPMESRPVHGADDDKPTVISELSSRLQQLNKDTRSLGEEPTGPPLDPGKKSPVVAARSEREREEK
uniref:SH3 and multiple ankyrin repeat domains 3 n=1 Tax=Pelodiscus sinensis TaxID=13735 RepID=K7FME6_PELSI